MLFFSLYCRFSYKKLRGDRGKKLIQITTTLKLKISCGQFSKLKEENNDDFNYFKQHRLLHQ
jgi:hypothetical protein